MSHIQITVLITRPLQASQQLAAQLELLGMSPLVMPMYTFSARESGLDVGACWSDRGRKLAVFTSPRSVEYGLAFMQANKIPGLELAVVGSATRSKLESSGYRVHLQADKGFTSEDLLQLPSLAVDAGEAVIFCAPGGRDTLASGLSELGWDVKNAFVYERVSLEPTLDQLDDLEKATKLLSVWTSVSALDIAHEQLPGDLWEKVIKAPALVISTRIQHHLQQFGATHIKLSEGPGNPELLRSIVGLNDRNTDN
jgi:uroporphyrinogen-III synthase